MMEATCNIIRQLDRNSCHLDMESMPGKCHIYFEKLIRLSEVSDIVRDDSSQQVN
jgi:hypothetical protein